MTLETDSSKCTQVDPIPSISILLAGCCCLSPMLIHHLFFFLDGSALGYYLLISAQMSKFPFTLLELHPKQMQYDHYPSACLLDKNLVSVLCSTDLLQQDNHQSG